MLKGLQLLNFAIFQQIVKYNCYARNKRSNSTSHKNILLSFERKFRRGHMGWIYFCFTSIQTKNNGKDHRLMWTLLKHVAYAMLKFGSAVLAEYYSKLLPCYLYCLFGGISAQVCQKHFSAIMPNSKMTFASQSSLI